MRLLELLKKASDEFAKAGIDDALPDAEMLVFHAVGTDRLDAYLNNPEVKSADVAKAGSLIRRRAKGEPAQYIIGHIEFFGLTIHVGKGVLIPRPETELLVEEVIKTVKGEGSGIRSREKASRAASHALPLTPHPSLSLLDLCTGSGCIALALAKEFPDAEVYGTDLSKEALRYAKKNARANNIGNVRFFQGPLFAPVKGRKFHIITANPPYIRRDELGTLQREIRDWEPVAALDGGEDGMDFYRRILSSAAEYLTQGGLIFLELGYDQAEAVQQQAEAEAFKEVAVIKDYAGIGRILKARISPRMINPRTCKGSRS
jgi:release factor glutamine methyltransferase